MSDGASSTTDKGNDFRDRVKRLLELTPGCTNVQAEYLIGTQPVDLYYEEHTSVRPLRVACECKDYGEPLTKDLIARHIYPRYAPLLGNRQIDAVRIIAPRMLGPTASAYVRECSFTFHTLDQVELEVIDFRQYLRAMKNIFAADGLDQYYVRPLLTDGQDLEALVGEWIAGDSSQPLAILGGYGMGKTSFARYLAHRLAAAALEDTGSRIPILIPLSEIATAQDLEGLLGKLLSAQHRVPGYHFDCFHELNRRGRFLTLLDGFDEMKHTMSWHEFTNNFTELNRLCVPGSRVILLGRPSALLSEDEELYVLRGRRRAGNHVFTVAGAPEYRELRLAEFTSDQAMTFMQRYANYRNRAHAPVRAPSPGLDLDARLEHLKNDPEMMALVQRPVQARMLADLAIDPEVQWRSFNRYELYREFIGRITEREARKPTRAVLPRPVRESFIRKVAWWVWNHASSSGFHIGELPPQVIPPYPADIARDEEGVTRDLISGSILEKKTGDNYYFPHRSFVEFLVAECICLEGPLELEDISNALNAEVVSFIKESNHAKLIAVATEDLRDTDGGPLSTRMLDLVAWARNEVRQELPDVAASDASPRELIVDYFRRQQRGAPPHELANFLAWVFVTCSDVQTRLMALLGLLWVEEAAGNELAHAPLKRVLAFLLVESLPEIKRLNSVPQNAPVAIDRRTAFVPILIRACSSITRSGRATITVMEHELHEAIDEAILPEWSVGSKTEPEAIPYAFHEVALTDLSAFEKRLALSEDGGHVTAFFRRYPEPAKLIPITGRKTRRPRAFNERRPATSR